MSTPTRAGRGTKAEPTGTLSPQDRHLYRRAISSISSEARSRKRKAKIETRAERIAAMTVTVRRPAKITSLFLSLVEILSRDRPDSYPNSTELGRRVVPVQHAPLQSHEGRIEDVAKEREQKYC